jgi:CYTH domain-containing protein
MEIERKFKLTQLPDLPEVVHLDQWQGYLATQPEVRIRHTVNHTAGTENYILCIKSVGDLVRHEVETPITQPQFEELVTMLDYTLIHKQLHAYRLPDGHVIECSLVDEGAFSYAEVEFDSEEEALAWTPPEWLGREMTYETGFKMRSYWSDRSLAKNI